MSFVTDKELHILLAAKDVFHRYGVKRASMSDIATEAGVSRQTLYNTFANKNDILRAAIRAFTVATLADFDQTLGGLPDLRTQLDHILTKTALEPYVDLHSSPNAQDLIDGYNESGRAVLEEAYVKYRAVMAAVLTPYATPLARCGMTPGSMAEVIQRSASAFKYQAQDEAHLRSLLDNLIALAICASGESVHPPTATAP